MEDSQKIKYDDTYDEFINSEGSSDAESFFKKKYGKEFLSNKKIILDNCRKNYKLNLNKKRDCILAIPQLLSLENLDLSGQGLTNKDINALCCALPKLLSLKFIDLSNNHLNNRVLSI